MIGILLYFWETNDEVAYGIQVAIDALKLSWLILKAIVITVIHGIIAIALELWANILKAFYGIEEGIDLLKIGFTNLKLHIMQICENIVNSVIRMYNRVADILGNFGINLGHAEEVDWTSDLENDLQNQIADYAKSKVEHEEAINSILEEEQKHTDKIAEAWSDVWNTAGEMNATRADRVANRFKISDYVNGNLDITGSGLGNTLDSIIGSDGSGGKALKTTTNDDLSISDEDLQFLLDIATRDYKLNYQQVTPSITLTFGDVHETADVDGVLEAVATQLEEIYDGNLST